MHSSIPPSIRPNNPESWKPTANQRRIVIPHNNLLQNSIVRPAVWRGPVFIALLAIIAVCSVFLNGKGCQPTAQYHATTIVQRAFRQVRGFPSIMPGKEKGTDE